MAVSENIVPAMVLTILAGLSTGIGSAIAYRLRKPKIVYLSFSLGLSAGVMISVSFMDLLPGALLSVGKFWAITAFFLGVAVIGLIDMLTPGAKNPHNYRGLDAPTDAPQNNDLMRTGIMTALAIGIHNLPEGMVTFASALSDVRLGLFIAIAIALHNIPEGIAVSVPIFYATLKKNKAFFWSFLSGISEPVGAAIGYLILLPFLTPAVLAATLAFVAGVMIYISLDELLPMAHRYGYGHVVIWGVVLGMLIMAISLVLL